ncbi:hypothetical protein [Sphingomonas sp. S2-65]|uniref:hypothetical protein n=1 Tax=Sphingomonas sp. S2-65 TaxID=2903960 RepID=UPI001F16AE82|nr:hypothetical protein [Sphingomonas sp. S2-65]UYY57196.1 hypothetical protein LZ586_10905 [Sphingomonas sp. S2-65]
MIDLPYYLRMQNRFGARLLLAALSLTAASCSDAAPAGGGNGTAPAAPSTKAADLPPAAAPTSAAHNPAQSSVSKVLAKQDTAMANGGTSCLITFAYAGTKQQQFLWERESCAKVDAAMIGRAKLEELGAWTKLDSYGRSFVGSVRDGKLLYVSGESSASLIPIDETGEPYEVEVAD